MKPHARHPRVLPALLIAALLLFALPTGTFADEGIGIDPWGEIPQIVLSSAAAFPGEEVTLTLRAVDMVVTTSFTATVSYDPLDLIFLSSTGAEVTETAPGRLTIRYRGKTGKIADLTFALSLWADGGHSEIVSVGCDDYSILPLDGKITVKSPIVAGDVDGDGDIDLLDLTLLAQYLANFDAETGASSVGVSTGADVNGDGIVNNADLPTLAQFLANLASD